ncbi:MAG TPA: allantoate amidohydrolase [Terriglobales bacterium]|nr:allantoate amidohydrolase [Terriglobales bacterium]
MESQARTVVDRCRRLATFTVEPGRTTRTFLSAPMRDCHREISGWVRPLGAQVRIDAVGNFRALYPGTDPQAPRLLIGSHLDTVPNAGAFDGILGVVLGTSMLELLEGEPLPFAIEVIGFSDEEGVRFGIPFIGSRALAGTIDQKLLDHKDAQGKSVRDAIQDFGLNPREIPEAGLQQEAFGYIEFHIEQGPVLEQLGLPLAAVEAIAGQSRLEVTFTGRANHAGTTPMRMRRDALAGAAEWISAIELQASRVTGLVATVGAVHAKPGAANVIAGEARLSLDVRHAVDETRLAAVDSFLQSAQQIAIRRQLSVRHRIVLNQRSTAMDSALVACIEEAMRRAGCKPQRMVSGAGHDAMVLAEKIPTAMMFLRTPGGISHHPDEDVKIEDVEKTLEAGMHLLEVIASSSTLPKHRIQRA